MKQNKNIIIKNIYYMLSYAFTSLNRGEYDNVSAEDFDNIHNLFAAILSKGVSYQLKQGLYREYIDKKEDLSVVRGKIDMPGTIQNQIARKRIVTCEYDELSENNLLNQIVKTSVFLLLNNGTVKKEYKDALKKEMLFFAEVDIIDPRTIRWSSIRFQRNNRSYVMLIGVCQLLLQGLLQTTEKGEHKLLSFIDDQAMNRLYEKFLLEYYRVEHPELKAEASYIDWQLDDDNDELLPAMKTDITLSKKYSNDNRYFIIDAKYYSHTTQSQFDKHSIHSGNLYQMFAYVKNKEYELKNVPHEVAGMLLYAETEDDIQPDNKYQMSGNTIYVRTLDLNKDFSEIRKQLDVISDSFFG